MTDGTASLITTLSMNGDSSVSKRCSLVAPVRWVFAAIAVLHLNVRIHASFAKPVNPKPAVPVGSKAPNNGLPSSGIFCRIASGNTLPSRCPTCFGLSSTTTGPYLINFFAVPRGLCSNTPDVMTSKLAFFVRYILTVANSINIRTFIYR